MEADVRLFLTHLSEEFSRGEVAQVYERFTTPTAIYIADRLLVIGRFEEFAAAFATYHGGLIAAGLARTTTRINGTTETSDDKIVASVTCLHEDATGASIGNSEVKYYFRRHGTTLKIELTEYLALPIDTAAFTDDLMSMAV